MAHQKVTRNAIAGKPQISKGKTSQSQEKLPLEM